MKETRTGIHVGIIGYGTVGTGVVQCLMTNEKYLQRHLGFPLQLIRLADCNADKMRSVSLPHCVCSTNADDVLADDHVEIVVELIGGTTDAKDIILRALRAGKNVVTANKALLAECGMELHATAEKHNVDLFYEASVAGGIPIIKTLRESFVANRIDSLTGILNGTSNYVLTRMHYDGMTFENALTEAQDNGYAERDPTLDVEGYDARHKIGILASLAFGRWVTQEEIYVEGIRHITPFDITYAAEMGYTIKLLALAKVSDRAIEVRVAPALVPIHSMLAQVNGPFNAVEIDGYPIGRTLFYGQGAGMNATASAVVADIIDIARNIGYGSQLRMPAFTFMHTPLPVRPMSDIITRYYIRCTVIDKPGVIARLAHELGARNISLSSVIQHESDDAADPCATVTFMTHKAREENVQEAVRAIDACSFIQKKTMLLRVETDT